METEYHNEDKELIQNEKIPTKVFDTSSEGSVWVAHEIVKLVKERAAQNKTCVLGLATGSTPTKVYDELVRLHKEEKVSFKNVITFNLDEYFPMAPDRVQSYNRFMAEYLFDHIDVPKENINIPDGTIPKEKVEEFCKGYEKKILDCGGIDIQILGIGRTGHIGFNEPGSSRASRTRLIYLNKITQIDAASSFFGFENVPKMAITMGNGTILNAKRVIIMAWSESKARIV
jgi:glucosamine-6-phosphate deaminase